MSIGFGIYKRGTVQTGVPDTFYFPTFRICSGRGMIPRLTSHLIRFANRFQ